jgi:hypothetical protein
LANVLNDISNFETGQISVQNNSQTVAVTNTPTLDTFRIPEIQSTSGLTISSINNCTVNFKLSSIIYHFKIYLLDAQKCLFYLWLILLL